MRLAGLWLVHHVHRFADLAVREIWQHAWSDQVMVIVIIMLSTPVTHSDLGAMYFESSAYLASLVYTGYSCHAVIVHALK